MERTAKTWQKCLRVKVTDITIDVIQFNTHAEMTVAVALVVMMELLKINFRSERNPTRKRK